MSTYYSLNVTESRVLMGVSALVLVSAQLSPCCPCVPLLLLSVCVYVWLCVCVCTQVCLWCRHVRWCVLSVCVYVCVCVCVCVFAVIAHIYLAVGKAKVFKCPFQEDEGGSSIRLWRAHGASISYCR